MLMSDHLTRLSLYRTIKFVTVNTIHGTYSMISVSLGSAAILSYGMEYSYREVALVVLGFKELAQPPESRVMPSSFANIVRCTMVPCPR